MSVDELADRSVSSELEAQPTNGFILDDATTQNHPVRVTIEDFDDHRSFGPMLWPSRVDDSGTPMLPQQGDPCLVLFDRERRPWIAAWTGGIPDPAFIGPPAGPHPMSIHTGTGFTGGQVPVWDGDSWEAMTPAAAIHTHPQSDVTGLVAALAAKQDAATAATDAELAAGMALKQDLDATLTALAGLATGANKFPYSTGADAFAQADLTAYMRTVLDDADAHAARMTLGAMGKPLQNDGVRWVGANGADSNDGLSPATAKLTWQAAIDDLPAAGGILYALGGNYNVTATVAAAAGKPVHIVVLPGVTLRASGSIAGPVLRVDKITQNPGIGVEGGLVIDMNNEAGTGAAIGLQLRDCWALDCDVRVINPGAGLAVHCVTLDPAFGCYYNLVRGQARFTKATGTATVTTGSPNLTLVTPTTLWKNGMVVTGVGIPDNTTILSGAGTATMVMSANATGAGGAGVAIQGRRGTGSQVEGLDSTHKTNLNRMALHVTGAATGYKQGPFVDESILEDCDMTDNAIAYDITAGICNATNCHEEINATYGWVVRTGATCYADMHSYFEKSRVEGTGVLQLDRAWTLGGTGSPAVDMSVSNTGNYGLTYRHEATSGATVILLDGVEVFRIGRDGKMTLGTDAMLKRDAAGILAARNAADSAYAIMRGATPAAANDLTTKGYVDGGFQAVGAVPTNHASRHQPGGADAMAIDAAAATGSLRTLGPGAAQAMPGNTAVVLTGDAKLAVPAWATVAYAANWQRKGNAAGDEVQAIVDPVSGQVQLRGRLERITSVYALGATAIMTLPAGKRPGRQMIVWVMRTNSTESTNGMVRMVIATSGDCNIDQEGFAAFTEAIGDYLYLDGVTFSSIV